MILSCSHVKTPTLKLTNKSRENRGIEVLWKILDEVHYSLFFFCTLFSPQYYCQFIPVLDDYSHSYHSLFFLQQFAMTYRKRPEGGGGNSHPRQSLPTNRYHAPSVPMCLLLATCNIRESSQNISDSIKQPWCSAYRLGFHANSRNKSKYSWSWKKSASHGKRSSSFASCVNCLT